MYMTISLPHRQSDSDFRVIELVEEGYGKDVNGWARKAECESAEQEREESKAWN